ncbi:hypothetical protein KYB31_07770 [Clostridium felsineum]|uniref:hypothetical protein n=1 Tax=Clostridium felsineum TaxID=36839 RepID=UPI00214DE85E|nr:hypothetical protein [Clostridium felsineum]MCR3758886.1 hypothetical protein [Clostridium felsineum]
MLVVSFIVLLVVLNELELKLLLIFKLLEVVPLLIDIVFLDDCINNEIRNETIDTIEPIRPIKVTVSM